MMKKVIILLMLVIAAKGVSQNIIQQQYSNIGLTNQSVMQQQSNSVFALNITNTNKPQRQSIQRQPIRQVVNHNANPSLPIQNLDVQSQSNAAEKNLSNDMNNFQLIQLQQISNITPPQIQIGTRNDLELKLLNIQLNVSKTFRRNNSEGYTSKHQLIVLQGKIKKISRKLVARLSFKKRNKIKLDNCFKW